MTTTGAWPACSSSGTKKRPETGRTPKTSKNVRGGHREVDALGLFARCEVRSARVDCGEVFVDCALRAPVEEVCGRDLNAPALWAQLLNRDDALRVRVCQRPQEHGVDDGEDCRVRTDPERQRQHGDESKPRIAAHRPEPVTHVLKQRPHKLTPFAGSKFQVASSKLKARAFKL